VRTCVLCNEQNPDRATFCLGCGAALGAVVARDHQTRRIVTVVFCDVAIAAVFAIATAFLLVWLMVIAVGFLLWVVCGLVYEYHRRPAHH